MAVTVIAGLAAAGASVAALGFTTAAFTAFAIGAGLSLVSRALAPKPSFGAALAGTNVTVREPDASRKIIYGRARVGGAVVFIDSTGTKNEYLHMVVAVAGHQIDAFEEVWFNDEKIWDGSFRRLWGNYVYLGFHDGSQTTADATLVAASPKWTSDHILNDTAYIYVRLKYDVEQFAQGLPNISTVIRGKKVLNPLTSVTEWTQNPALCVYDYLTDTKYGLAESGSSVNTASLTTAVSNCNDLIALEGGGDQPRYTLDGVVDTANSRKENIEAMLSGMAGNLVYSGGEYFISAAKYVAPAVTIDESVIVGGIDVRTKQSRRSLYNGVKGVFLSEEDNYILADYPAQISSTYSTEDGDPIYLDMTLPFTTNNVRAQRIAKLALLRSRQQTTVTIPCNLAALKFKAGDNIMVTNAKMKWEQKVFEVVGYNLNFTSDGAIIVEVDAIETAAEIYDWQSTDAEDYLAGGEIDLYDGKTAEPPTALNITSDSFLNDDGTFNAQFNVSWTNAEDAFTDHYVVEWKLSAESNYYGMTLRSSPAVITGLQTAQNYDVRVKAINELGVSSTYASANQVAAIDTTAPNAPSGLSVTGHYQHNSLSWTNPTASDLNRIDVYRSTTSGGTYSVIGNTDGTVYIDDNLANDQTFFYKLKAIDFTGNASVFSGIDSATTTIIEAGDLGEDSIATVNIQDLAVATDKIDNDAVTISKIATSLQSTNYVAGTSGWKILKSGAVEFEEAIIRGTISATSGSISDTVTIGGTAASTIVAGASDGATALQDSDTDINLGLTGGTIAGITISGTKLYEGTGTFNNSNTGFYLDNTGQFSLKDKLSFDGSTLAVIGDITADNLNVTNATVTGSFVADNLPTLQNMNGVITVNQINANTITVDKLSGDVSETYPINYPSSIGVCSGSVVTNNDVRLTVPAPSGDVEKNATVSLTIKMSATNGYTSGTSTIVASCDLRLQRLSTGITTGTAIGASVVEVLSLAGNIKRLKIVGNHLDNLATIGSISRSSTGAVGFTITPVLGYYYQNTVTGYSGNFTYVFTSSSTDITVGSSFYFNKDAWQSQGVWISSENYERLYFQVQPQDTVTKDYTIHETLGKTLSGENFRLTATQYENTSGSNTPITVHNVSGTMQLIT